LSREPPLRLGQALALGALHGPAELLPISSSGHVALVPWLLGWDYPALEPELRKAFEVALHAGTAAGLLIALRDDVRSALREASPRLALLLALSLAPPAVSGLRLERLIEQRLGGPRSVAAGLIAGSVAMAWADRSAPQVRAEGSAGGMDAIWLGVAQACALAPGVSRGGATLAAARARGFTREEAARLSSLVALPVIVGATGLKLVRLRSHGLPRPLRLPFAAGAAAAFASTLSSGRLVRGLRRGRTLHPYACYRLALAALVLARLRSGR
jgi:undecaprenyl-diphosphatase